MPVHSSTLKKVRSTITGTYQKDIMMMITVECPAIHADVD